MRSLPSASLALLLSLGSLGALAPTAAPAQIGISVGFAPPPLPAYYQPPLPGYGYIWTPGYWAWDAGFRDYYWVPGLWVRPPRIGFLWTPGYWGWQNGAYLFNAGYWGPTVGFYGGINYGYGYGGFGYAGGQWRGGRLFYNAAANNMTGFRGAYTYRQAVSTGPGGRVSFNGGTGGVHVAPTPAQLAAAHQSHVGATAVQQSHLRTARATPGLRFQANHGAPPAALASRAGSPRSEASRATAEGRSPTHSTARDREAVRERGSQRTMEPMARSSREEGRPAIRQPGAERGEVRGGSGETGGPPRRPEMGPAGGPPRGAERGPAGGGQGGGPREEDHRREGGPH